MQNRLLEPEIEIVPTAFACPRGRLRLALGTARLAIEANVKVIVVAPPRSHFGKPAAIRPRLAAQGLLDRRIDEDALDRGILRGSTNEFGTLMRPNRRIDIAPIRSDHLRGRGEFAFLACLH